MLQQEPKTWPKEVRFVAEFMCHNQSASVSTYEPSDPKCQYVAVGFGSGLWPGAYICCEDGFEMPMPRDFERVGVHHDFTFHNWLVDDILPRLAYSTKNNT